jgi:hypothetical protein
MTNTWALCALWVDLAFAATLLAIWFNIPTAPSEIVAGTVAQLVIGVFLIGLFGFAQDGLAGNAPWMTFLAGTGAIVRRSLQVRNSIRPSSKPSGVRRRSLAPRGSSVPFLGCLDAWTFR